MSTCNTARTLRAKSAKIFPCSSEELQTRTLRRRCVSRGAYLIRQDCRTGILTPFVAVLQGEDERGTKGEEGHFGRHYSYQLQRRL